MTSFREGLAATRIADFLNEQLKLIGETTGIPTAVIAILTPESNVPLPV